MDPQDQLQSSARQQQLQNDAQQPDHAAVTVAVRMRPLNSREKAAGTTAVWTNDARSLWATTPTATTDGSSAYTFDHVFGPAAPTSTVYASTAAQLVDACLRGFNGTIFAYGQTSSGKTHTMMGDAAEPGIIPLAIRQVFDHIAACPARAFVLSVSYLEIYNEVIRDLIEPTNVNLKIHETVSRDIFVGNLSEHVVSSPYEIQTLLSLGERNRHIGETNMNEKSSRSHTIFKMVIESRPLADLASPDAEPSDLAVKVSHLNLVDLAGSERVGHTGAEGMRLREGGHINKSLLALASVIGKLSEGGDKRHIPYRNSKLTRILQPSLGGNAKTSIICTVTPAALHIDETQSTLRFASRAKTITNRPVVNETVSDETLLKRYRREIEALKTQLARFQSAELDRTSSSTPTPSESSPAHPSHRHSTASDCSRDQIDDPDRIHINEKLDALRNIILNAPKSQSDSSSAAAQKRRRTWFQATSTSSYTDSWVSCNKDADINDSDFASGNVSLKHKMFLPLEMDVQREQSTSGQDKQIQTEVDPERDLAIRLQAAKDELELQLAQLNDQLEAARSDLSAVESELTAKIAIIETDKHRLSSLVEQLENARCDSDTIKSDLNSKIIELESEKHSLESRMSQLDKQLEDARCDSDTIKSDLSSKIIELQTEKERMESHISRLEDQLKTAQSDNADTEYSLNARISQLDFERSQLESCINELKLQLVSEKEQFESRVGQLDMQLQAALADRAKAETGLSDTILQLQSEKVKLESKVKDLESFVDQCCEDEIDLKSQNKYLTAENSKLEQNVSNLTDKLEASDSAYSDLETETENKIKQMESEKHQLQDRVTELDKQLEDARSDNTSIESSLNTRISQLESEKTQLQSRVTELNKQLGVTQTALDQLESETSTQIEMLQTERDEMEQRVVDLISQLNATQADRSARENELVGRVRDAEHQRDELDMRVKTICKELDSAKRDHDKQVVQMKTEMRRVVNDRDQLGMKVRDLDTQLRDVESRSMDVQTRLQSTISGMESKLANLNAQCDEYQTMQVEMQRKHDDLVDRYDRVVMENKEKDAMMDGLRKQTMKLESMVMSMQSDLTARDALLEESHQSHHDMKMLAQTLTGDKENLAKELSEIRDMYQRTRQNAERLSVLLEDEKDENERLRMQHQDDLDMYAVESRRLEHRATELLKELEEARERLNVAKFAVAVQTADHGETHRDVCVGTSLDMASVMSSMIDATRYKQGDADSSSVDDRTRRVVQLEHENAVLKQRLRETQMDLVDMMNMAPADHKSRGNRDGRRADTSSSSSSVSGTIVQDGCGDRDDEDGDVSAGSMAVESMDTLLDQHKQASGTTDHDEAYIVATANAKISRQEAEHLRNELNTCKMMLANERTMRRQLELETTDLKDELRHLRHTVEDMTAKRGAENQSDTASTEASQSAAANRNGRAGSVGNASRCAVTRGYTASASASKPPTTTSKDVSATVDHVMQADASTEATAAALTETTASAAETEKENTTNISNDAPSSQLTTTKSSDSTQSGQTETKKPTRLTRSTRSQMKQGREAKPGANDHPDDTCKQQ